MSPTEHEYDYSKQRGKTRLIYIWGAEDTKRAPKMQDLIRKASKDLIRRRVENRTALRSEVYESIVDYLDRLGFLQIPPFDTSPCDGASLPDISRDRVSWFLDTAHRERGFPLTPSTSTEALLVHLNLLRDGKPTNAAILLFGTKPQVFHRAAEIKCVFCYGTQYKRPFASQQIYSGDIFEQADQARDFVLAKIDRTVGSRNDSNIAPAKYELPPEAIAEAIINALAHRDYNSNASVEVRLFADRLEIWNPGTLPGTLTLDALRTDHASVPNNPLVAEPLYLTRYIEKAGSGTQMMIERCNQVGLPEPDFQIKSGSFVTTLWRDWLTESVLAELGLNERQRRAILTVKTSTRIGNKEYQTTFGVSKPTATRDLEEMVKKGVLSKVGTTGKGTYYILSRKGLIKGSKGSFQIKTLDEKTLNGEETKS